MERTPLLEILRCSTPKALSRVPIRDSEGLNTLSKQLVNLRLHTTNFSNLI